MDAKLLNGCIEVFKEKGVKFRMDDLAAHLGMSKRTIYELVPTKEQLLLDGIEFVFAQIKEAESAIFMNEDLDDVEKLKQLIIVLPQSIQTLDYSRVHEVKKFLPSVYESMVRHMNEGWEPTLQLIQKCIDANLLKPMNPLIVKHMIIGCMNDLLEHDYLQQEGLDYEETLKQMIEVIFEGLRT